MYCRIVLFLVVAILSVAPWLVRTDDVFAQQPYNHDLRLRNRGDDVQRLQKYLNRMGITIARIGADSRGQETTYYGEVTRSIAIRFQEIYATHILRSLGIAFQEHPSQPIHVPSTNQPVYKIGGEVTGLRSPVTLVNNSIDTLWVKPGDTATFWFAKGLFSGESYAVTARSEEGSGQYCFISPNGRGVIASRDVGMIKVMCSLDPSNDPFTVRPGGGGEPMSQVTYAVGGTVSNLLGTLVLRNNGVDDLVLNESGPFIFSTRLANGANYAVTIQANPSAPEQTCEILNGSGSVRGEQVSSVSISCRTAPTLSLNTINKTYGDEPFFITATSTSDGVITYTSSDTSVASISGSTVTIVGAGSTTMTATLATSTLYTATSTSAILTVERAVPVIAAIGSVSVNSAQYSGICFEDFDALTFCTLDTPLRIDLPTSTSNGAFTSLTASNTDVIASSTPAVSFVLGYPVMDAAFSFPLAFDAFFLLTPGPFTTVATLHQATTTNYTAGSASFTVTVELTNQDPEGNSCFNRGVMLRTPYDTYECACPTTFTGQYCQTVVPG